MKKIFILLIIPLLYAGCKKDDKEVYGGTLKVTVKGGVQQFSIYVGIDKVVEHNLINVSEYRRIESPNFPYEYTFENVPAATRIVVQLGAYVPKKIEATVTLAGKVYEPELDELTDNNSTKIWTIKTAQ